MATKRVSVAASQQRLAPRVEKTPQQRPSRRCEAESPIWMSRALKRDRDRGYPLDSPFHVTQFGAVAHPFLLANKEFPSAEGERGTKSSAHAPLSDFRAALPIARGPASSLESTYSRA